MGSMRFRLLLREQAGLRSVFSPLIHIEPLESETEYEETFLERGLEGERYGIRLGSADAGNMC